MGNVEIEKTKIIKNSVSNMGAGIVIIKSEKLSIEASEIVSNEASGASGITVESVKTLNIRDSIIEGNVGTGSIKGGAVLIKDVKDCLIDTCQIQNNKGSDKGGALAITQTESFKIKDSYLFQNFAER